MQEFTTVFDITHRGFDWWFPAFGLILVVGGAIKICRRKPEYRWGYAIVTTGLVFSYLAVSSMYPYYGEVRRAYLAKQYSVVEGAVENFHPMPFEGHQDECFSVQGVQFCYSDYIVGPGFNNTSSHGGPIRAGLPVRVSYIANDILKLEIRSDSVPSPAESRRRRLKAIGSYLMLLLPLPAFVLAINIAVRVYKKIRTTTT